MCCHLYYVKLFWDLCCTTRIHIIRMTRIMIYFGDYENHWKFPSCSIVAFLRNNVGRISWKSLVPPTIDMNRRSGGPTERTTAFASAANAKQWSSSARRHPRHPIRTSHIAHTHTFTHYQGNRGTPLCHTATHSLRTNAFAIAHRKKKTHREQDRQDGRTDYLRVGRSGTLVLTVKK